MERAGYALLLDPHADGSGAIRLVLPDGAPLDAAADALAGLLELDDTVDQIDLVVGAEKVGTTSRSYARVVLEMRHTRSSGDEVRAGWPGESTRYSLLEFACDVCGGRSYATFYDERFTPVCDRPEHGRMQLRTISE